MLLSLAASIALAGCGAQLYLYQLVGPDHQYVSAQRVVASVPPPPAPGSPAYKKDIQTLLDWQARRTKAECAAAGAQARADYDKFFGDVSPFPAPLPKAASSILFKVYYDGGKAVSAAKEKFERPRPFRSDKAIKPCIGKPFGDSYPSGHATVSHLMALVLSDADPPDRAAFMAKADQAALNRVIAGVHYPSDVEAGKLYGDAIYAEMQKEPAFRADLAKLKTLVKKR